MKIKKLTVLIALAGLAGAAQATDGYFADGYGMKAEGMGGASMGMADDTSGGANNPASMAFVGDRFDVGVDLFSPRRTASRTGANPMSPIDGSVDSDSDYFVIPDFGYNKMLTPSLALGVTVYGNGGMNTNFGPVPGFGNTNLLGGSGKLGVNLEQLVVAPTLAFKITPDHAIGISPLIGYQRFEAYGLQAFEPFSATFPTNRTTNNGTDDSWGYGVRVGYQGRITPTLTLGAAYASKMSFDKFNNYAGLFAGQGAFDIPENYDLGLAWQATPQILLALDYERINYSKVNSVGDQQSNIFGCPALGGANPADCLGGNSGAGFGWQDVNIWKLGMEYQLSSQWTLRAGYNHTDDPITSANTTFNILAPGVVADHATLGFTYMLGGGGELSMAYMHAFKNSVSGHDPFFGGTDTISMYQDSIGISYGMKL
jgi:long-chain fatty acid transport protein